ncbi:MAG TPA: penicillin acylase family protein, partial [Gammaproteobacteria bacterium]|nr:penicillin acylase family protein [Gammaproteobacteria bacterium]
GLIGGHVMITDGIGAGQIRAISNSAGTTLTVSSPFTVTPGSSSVYVAVNSGGNVTAVAYDSGAWQEESTTAYAFSLFQKATTVMDMRQAVRLIPSTHNFFAADNQAFNGTGTAAAYGNIGYFSSGYSRKRQNAQDKLLPIDGTQPNPLVVASGTVDTATSTQITDATATFGSYAPDPINFRYLNPGSQGQEYVLSIISGTGGKQSRRIASSTGTSVTVEYPWGVTPAPGDFYEISEVVGMPEAVNPSEGYVANWNNKASNSDDGDNFGREHRVTFILERLAADNSWTRDDQRQLNKAVGGLDGRGVLGRQIVPRIRQAVTAEGNGGNMNVDTVLAALEAHNAAPMFGRYFEDPVTATTGAGEVAFLNTFINNLATAIFGDEYAGAIGVPTGTRALALVVHAIDSAANSPAGHYSQEYSGDYFNGTPWTQVVRDTFSALATGGIPAPSARGTSSYNHPLAALNPALSFDPTPLGNRGTWEQIVESGPTVKGEFMFPLGQSGDINGTFTITPTLNITSIDSNVTSMQPIWRDWRFLPMLHVAETIEGGSSTGDADADGVLDGFEKWYFDATTVAAKDNGDGDKSKLVDEFENGSDPTDADTDDDGLVDGFDGRDQDRLASGFTKMTASFKLNGIEDAFQMSGKFGTGSTVFDPAADAIDLRVETLNGDAVYAVTVPAGTLTGADGKYSYKDPDGAVNMLTSVQLKLGKAADKSASFKLKTAKQNLPTVATSGTPIYQVLVTIHDASASSSRLLLDAREWDGDVAKTKAAKEPGTPVYH